MRFILHIGPPKTATTSIQRNLDFFFRPEMNDNKELFIGEKWNRILDDSPDEPFSSEKLSEMISSLRSEAVFNRFPAILISSETIWNMKKEIWESLFSNFSIRDEISIVIGFRKRIDLDLSLWQQSVRQGNFAGFEEWVQGNRSLHNSGNPNFYFARLNLLAQYVPLENVRYFNVADEKIETMKNFLNACDMPFVEGLNQAETYNESLGIYWTEVFRTGLAHIRLAGFGTQGANAFELRPFTLLRSFFNFLSTELKEIPKIPSRNMLSALSHEMREAYLNNIALCDVTDMRMLKESTFFYGQDQSQSFSLRNLYGKDAALLPREEVRDLLASARFQGLKLGENFVEQLRLDESKLRLVDL